MCKAKFTKGPWASNGMSCVCSASGELLVALTSSQVYRHDEEEDYANAHLIAAAPEMYEELQEVSNWMNSQLGMGDWHKDIEKLLAKARGEHV